MGIALSAKAVMRPNASRSFAFRSRSRHLSRKSSTPFADVDQCQHRIGTVGVLRQPAIAYFRKPPNPLEGQKRMFDFRAHSRLSAVSLPIAFAQCAVPVRTLVGEVLGARSNLLELLALVFSSIGTVAIQPALFTMQQIGQLLAVVHIGRGHARTVHQPALAIYADVYLHAEVPLIALLSLLHLRIALLLLIFSRGRGRWPVRVEISLSANTGERPARQCQRTKAGDSNCPRRYFCHASLNTTRTS